MSRLQLSRQKGFRLPADAMSVARPSRFGNPFAFDGCEVFSPGGNWWGTPSEAEARRWAVDLFRTLLEWGEGQAVPYPMPGELRLLSARRERILTDLHLLEGKRLACWCPPDVPCHADVLLEALAWKEGETGG